MTASRIFRLGTAGCAAILGSLAFAAPSQAVHQTVTGLTTANQIVQFAVGTPNALTSGPTPVTGIVGNLVGIDYRPRTGELFGVGDNGAVYVVNATTGAATPIGTAPVVNPFTNATDHGVDFNPNVDRIRVVNDAPSGADNNNFRFRPDNGALVTADTDLSEGTIVASAYDQNVDATPTTTLFGIDSDEDELVRQGGVNGGAPEGSPNLGVIAEIGPLGAGDITGVAGYDVETQTNVHYASLQATGDTFSRFVRINPATGAATAPTANDNRIGGAAGPLVSSVSLVPIPVLRFSNALTSVSEGDVATVTLTRTGLLNQTATINYTTEIVPGNTASADDYTTAMGTLTFPPGVASQSFTVETTEDTADESDETLQVRMSAPSASLNLGASPLVSTVNIVDDELTVVDGPPADPADPIDPTDKAGIPPTGLISVPAQPLDRSITARFSCDQACAAVLTLKGRDTKDVKAGTLSDSGAAEVTFEIGKRELKTLERKAERRGSVNLRIKGTFSDPDGSTRSRVKFSLG